VRLGRQPCVVRCGDWRNGENSTQGAWNCCSSSWSSGLLLDAFFVLSGATVLAAVDKRVILDIAQFAASAIAAFGVVLIYCEIRRRRRSG
jgi:hypothetical protein